MATLLDFDVKFAVGTTGGWMGTASGGRTHRCCVSHAPDGAAGSTTSEVENRLTEFASGQQGGVFQQSALAHISEIDLELLTTYFQRATAGSVQIDQMS